MPRRPNERLSFKPRSARYIPTAEPELADFTEREIASAIGLDDWNRLLVLREHLKALEHRFFDVSELEYQAGPTLEANGELGLNGIGEALGITRQAAFQMLAAALRRTRNVLEAQNPALADQARDALAELNAHGGPEWSPM